MPNKAPPDLAKRLLPFPLPLRLRPPYLIFTTITTVYNETYNWPRDLWPSLPERCDRQHLVYSKDERRDHHPPHQGQQ